MFNRVLSILESTQVGEDSGYTQSDIAVAVCALFYHIIAVDGVLTPSEIEEFGSQMRAQFSFSQEEIDSIVNRGIAQERESAGLFTFTSILNRELSTSKRQEIFDKIVLLAHSDGAVEGVEMDQLNHLRQLLYL